MSLLFSPVPHGWTLQLFWISCFYKRRKKGSRYSYTTYIILCKCKFSVWGGYVPRTRIAGSKAICMLHFDRSHKIAFHPVFYLKKRSEYWVPGGKTPFSVLSRDGSVLDTTSPRGHPLHCIRALRTCLLCGWVSRNVFIIKCFEGGPLIEHWKTWRPSIYSWESVHWETWYIFFSPWHSQLVRIMLGIS